MSRQLKPDPNGGLTFDLGAALESAARVPRRTMACVWCSEAVRKLAGELWALGGACTVCDLRGVK